MSRIVTFFFFVRNGLKGEKCRGKIPPGAFGRQKSGKPIPPWLIEPGHMSQYPVAEVNTCYIYAIVDLKTGKTYVGRTIKNPYVRFVEHRKSGDPLGKAILMDDSKLVVLTRSSLKTLPMNATKFRNSITLESKREFMDS